MRSDAISDLQHPELAPILNTVLDAVVIMDLDGTVVGWNTVAEHTFGWSREEVIGLSLAELLVPAEHRQAHKEGMARLLAGGEPRVLNRRIEITALTANRGEIPVELSITQATTTSGRLFVGFLRDIGREKEAEQALRRKATEAQLMFDVARMAAEADSFEEALKEVLAAICRISGWSVGHAFLVQHGDPPRLVSTSIWFEDEPGTSEPIRVATEAVEFTLGVGLPGTILERGEPLWVADVASDQNFPRASAGFRGAFGFPLKAGKRIIAILEFFARSPTPPDDQRLLTVCVLGEQIGRVFERRQREDRERLLLHELNHRVKNLLAVVQAIASQTFRKVASPEEGLAAFSGRLMALAQAQDLLLKEDFSDVNLQSLIEAAILGSGNTLDQFKIVGPEVKVTANRATSVALALHELCTNAVKYGALSLPSGHVTITWTTDADRRNLDFEWRELGGPPVTPPTRRGFGSTLLSTNLGRELSAEIEVEYPSEGLIFRVRAPLSDINRGGAPDKGSERLGT